MGSSIETQGGGARPGSAKKNLDPKLVHPHLFTILEASRQLRVSRHTLRYWEKALDGVVVPNRTDGGQRRYTPEHLCVLEAIKQLKRKGFTLAAIRDELSRGMIAEQRMANPRTLDRLADHIAETVRSSIYRFFRGED